MIRAMMRRAHWLAAALLLLLAALACSQPRWSGVLFDFESEAELDEFRWKCGQLFSLTEEHATHGRHCLRLEVRPVAKYSGLRPGLTNHDWSNFSALCFDAYNPQGQPVRVTVRLDDVRDRADYGDRFNHAVILAPGFSRVRLPLAGLTTSNGRRRLDLADIWALRIFMARPPRPTVLYLDYLHLEVASRHGQ